MPKIKSAKVFTKKLSKLIIKHPDLYDKIKKRIEMLAADPRAISLENHKLKGLFKNYYAFTITADCRIIFKIDSEGAYVFLNIGSHDEVY